MSPDNNWPDPLLNEVFSLLVGARIRNNTIAELEQEHNFEEAASIYLQQLKNEPILENYLGAGMNLARARDYDHALPLLREAIQLDPKGAKTHFTLAVTLFRRAEENLHLHPQTKEDEADFREAANHARMAVSLKPDYANACLIWGASLKHLGRMQEALDPLRKGIACRPEMFNLQITLAEVLFELGNFDEAQRHAEDAQHINSKDPRAAQLLERLRSKKHK